MRLLFAGTPAVALPALDCLLAGEHEVVAVLTRPDAPAGRHRRPTPSPVATAATAAGVRLLTPTRLSEPETLTALADLAVDLAVVVAYGALVPPAALALPRLGWVNLHFSLLPAWRGAAPVAHALLAGDLVTGATTFALDEGLDTGPVYGMVTEQVRPDDTAGALLDRLASSGALLLAATVDALADGSARAVPQPGEGVSTAPKLSVADARVDFAAPAFAVDRRVRAVTPAPGAWTTYAGQRLGLGPVALAAGGPALAPGELAVTHAGVLVGTATHPVALGEVRPAGRRPMASVDWARGARPEPGAHLGGPVGGPVGAP